MRIRKSLSKNRWLVGVLLVFGWSGCEWPVAVPVDQPTSYSASNIEAPLTGEGPAGPPGPTGAASAEVDESSSAESSSAPPTDPPTASPTASPTDVHITPVTTLVLVPNATAQLPRSYTGALRARRASDLAFKRLGRIVEMAVQEGEVVAAGQVLATLDQASLRANLAMLEAQKAAAEARLAEMVAGPRPTTLEAARAQVAELETQRQLAQLTFTRLYRLSSTSAVSQQDTDDARYQFAVIDKKLAAQQAVLKELELGTRVEQITAQQAVVAELNASLQAMNIELEESQLMAPFAGTISHRMLDEGAIATPGGPVLRIVEQAAPEIWVGLPVTTAAEISAEQVYSVALRGDQFAVKFHARLPEIDAATRTQTVVFVPSDEKSTAAIGSAALGQTVTLLLSQPVATAGYWVPLKSLSRGSRGMWAIFVVEPAQDATLSATVRRHDVEVLHVDSERVLVRGTIQAGDRIVTSAVQRLTSGQLVSISDESTIDTASEESVSPR